MPWNWIKRKLAGAPRAGAGSARKSRLEDVPACPWIEPADNPWGVRIIDVRPVTRLLSASTDAACARNGMSFRHDDGTSFIGAVPVGPERTVPADLVYPLDGHRADGPLFLPEAMEHKWAIYLHRGRLSFVRSWTRLVVATADLEVRGDAAVITRVHGTLAAAGDAGRVFEPEFTVRVIDFLMRTHALNVHFPAPLPSDDPIVADPRMAGLFCMSMFGQLAHYATFDPVPPDRGHALPSLRTHPIT